MPLLCCTWCASIKFGPFIKARSWASPHMWNAWRNPPLMEITCRESLKWCVHVWVVGWMCVCVCVCVCACVHMFVTWLCVTCFPWPSFSQWSALILFAHTNKAWRECVWEACLSYAHQAYLTHKHTHTHTRTHTHRHTHTHTLIHAP